MIVMSLPASRPVDTALSVVCCHCGKTRSASGAWFSLPALPPGRISRTICPRCLAERYPGYVDTVDVVTTGEPAAIPRELKPG